MSTAIPRRARKRQATKEAISQIATRMFIERGFDNVTMAEIADAADVARTTVFNHFPRKEDLFFDLEAEGRLLLNDALQHRAANVAPLDALQLLTHRAIDEERAFARFTASSAAFVETILESETLKSRARHIRDELAAELADALAKTVGHPHADTDAQLAAHLLLACAQVAYNEAHSTFDDTGSTSEANAVFKRVMEKGFVAVRTALAGTRYA